MRRIVTQALEMTMNNISTSGGLSIIDRYCLQDEPTNFGVRI